MTYWLHIFLFNISDSFDYFIVSEKPHILPLMSTESYSICLSTLGYQPTFEDTTHWSNQTLQGVFLPQQHINP